MVAPQSPMRDRIYRCLCPAAKRAYAAAATAFGCARAVEPKRLRLKSDLRRKCPNWAEADISIPTKRPRDFSRGLLVLISTGFPLSRESTKKSLVFLVAGQEGRSELGRLALIAAFALTARAAVAAIATASPRGPRSRSPPPSAAITARAAITVASAARRDRHGHRAGHGRRLHAAPSAGGCPEALRRFPGRRGAWKGEPCRAGRPRAA